MTPVFQSPERDRREQERQSTFRERFVAETPPWYHGAIHLGFTLLITGGTVLYCWNRIEVSSAWEWLLVVPIVLLGNWCEWAAHRYVLHRPVPGLTMIYKRHCTVHHQFFTHHDLGYSGHKEWRALLFPPFAPIGFVLAALPPALLAGWLISSNAGYIVVLTMAAYYLLYEGLHTLSHLDDTRHPYLRHIPLVNTVRRMHYIHHVLGFMQTRNFNLTFPICDALFGTSDLDRSLVGTLFNGASHDHMRADIRSADPDLSATSIEKAERRTRARLA
ncbi:MULTISPECIES: sterol desaturase family protein [Methylobacterium]|uniref:Fatty acid hydroxylase n=1 Tax=Methylobacterium currus TaxID=2051553 RepID=A0A2R4WW18_9HYPH|nr:MULTISPECIES: sterol desaturase family protein [Methylobacterium]AWB25739.1 fatty acid hydroxylase [Methylobacterium currus]SFF24604.1 Fatty acid hydroxylase superfamily protein [Methylobacterium sp. yr596]